MDRFAIVLLASAIGAAGGVFVAQSLQSPAPHPVEAGGAARYPAIEARLARIEAKLDDRPEPLTLQGSGARPQAAAAFSPDSPEGKALLAAIADKVRESTHEAITSAGSSGALGAAPAVVAKPPKPKKKRLPLSEVARELELSSSEEQALRDAYDDTREKMLKLLAGKDGDVEEVRRDLERSQEDPSQALTTMSKYLPNVTKNLGGIVSLQMSHRQSIREAIGRDKARRLDSEYSVEEADMLSISALMGRRRR